jgi:hypothetical protein
MAATSSSKSRRSEGRHHAAWLGAGAVAMGLGAAIAHGTGVAAATTGDDAGPSPSGSAKTSAGPEPTNSAHDSTPSSAPTVNRGAQVTSGHTPKTANGSSYTPAKTPPASPPGPGSRVSPTTTKTASATANVTRHTPNPVVTSLSPAARVMSSTAPHPQALAAVNAVPAAVAPPAADPPVTSRSIATGVLSLSGRTPLPGTSPTTPAAPTVSPVESLFVFRRLRAPSPFSVTPHVKRQETSQDAVPAEASSRQTNTVAAQAIQIGSRQINFDNITTSGVDEDALTVFTPGEKLLNFGRLTTTGDLAEGIFAAADDVTIHNSSRIDTSGLGAAGIFALGQDATITNFGSVATHGGTFDPIPDEEGDESFSDGITAFGDRFHITNYGRVSADGEFSSAMSGIGNDGAIVNNGLAENSSQDSIVIGVFGDRSQVINAGIARTTASTPTDDGVAVLFVLGEDAVARNTGLVSGTGTNITGISGVVGDTHVTNAGQVRIDGDNSIGVLGVGDNHEVTNVGTIVMHGDRSAGIAGNGSTRFDHPGTNNEVKNAGVIRTDGKLAVGAALGLDFNGFNQAASSTITNSGMIATHGDGSAAVVMAGDGHTLVNSGRLTSNGGELDSDTVGKFRAAGVVVTGNDALVQNTGTIASRNSASAAVELNIVEREGLPAIETSSQLENSGHITAPDVAVLGGAGQETVINRGTIIGDVSLGDGSDAYTFGRCGVVRGDVALGSGDDLVRVENDSGRSQVADFTVGDDVADVSAFYSSFDQVRANARQRGSDVVIRLDANDTLVLKNVDLNDLTAIDFVV